MSQDAPDNWLSRIKVAALLIVLVGFVGFMTDGFGGFPVTRESRSWAGWLGAMLGSGALYMAMEAVGEWINGRDSAEHPLRKRAWHLALLLALVVVSYIALSALLSVNH